MAKPLSTLLKKVSPAVQAKAAAKALALLEEISLASLRKELGITQTVMANKLNMKQPSVAQIEKQQDARLSTLRDYVAALGGELELYAAFPDGTRIPIHQFVVHAM